MLLYVLNLIDLLTTQAALALGAWELNPIAAWLQELHPALYPFVKIVPTFFLCWWLEQNATGNPPARKRLHAIEAIAAAVAANNCFVIYLM